MDKLLRLLSPAWLLILFGIICLLIALLALLRYKKALRAMSISGILGVAALVLCHFFGAAVGCCLPLGIIHIAVAWVLGIPGVLLMAVIAMI